MSVHLHPDFAGRVERSLHEADAARRKRAWSARLRVALPILLLAGPILAWHLLQHSAGSAHVAIAALSGVTFALNLGVHLDTSLLTSLGLSDLPTVVGLLLLVMVAFSVLGRRHGQ